MKIICPYCLEIIRFNKYQCQKCKKIVFKYETQCPYCGALDSCGIQCKSCGHVWFGGKKLKNLKSLKTICCLGDIFTGKTMYLTMLLHELTNNKNLIIDFLDDNTKKIYHDNSNAVFFNHSVVCATPPMCDEYMFQIYNYVSRKRRSIKFLDIGDRGNQILSISDTIKQDTILNKCDYYMFFIDLWSEKRNKNIEDYIRGISEYIAMLNKNNSGRIVGFCLVFTKSDLCNGNYEIANEVKNKIELMSYRSGMRKVKLNSFVVSSMGYHYKDGDVIDLERLRPVNLLEPLKYILGERIV